MILCLFITSCSRQKNLQKSTVVYDSIYVSNDHQKSNDTYIDTTKTESGKLTITEIDFYSPIRDTVHDSVILYPLFSNLEIPGLTINAVLIKSLKVTTWESEKVSKGETKTTDNEDVKVTATNLSAVKEDISEIVKRDNHFWKYTLIAICLVAVLSLLYIKRTPIINWFKNVFKAIRRIF